MTTRVPATMIGIRPTGGDDTAALQALINTGQDVVLGPGTYYGANLTQSTNN